MLLEGQESEAAGRVGGGGWHAMRAGGYHSYTIILVLLSVVLIHR